MQTAEIKSRIAQVKRALEENGYPNPSPEPETTAWQKNEDLMDWLKNLGR